MTLSLSKQTTKAHRNHPWSKGRDRVIGILAQIGYLQAMGYLVVQRKIGQRLLLKVEDVEIEVMISDIYGKRADLAIKAPKIVQIVRTPTHIQEELKKGRKT